MISGIIGGTLLPHSEKKDSTQNKEIVFHATLAEPKLYVNGIYTDTFEIEYNNMIDENQSNGQYVFDFVPNGSSPDVLSITLNGETLSYSEDFDLNGTRHEAGLGEFYTWEYLGDDTVFIPKGNTVIEITVDPNGNTRGSVSVYLYHILE